MKTLDEAMNTVNHASVKLTSVLAYLEKANGPQEARDLIYDHWVENTRFWCRLYDLKNDFKTAEQITAEMQ